MAWSVITICANHPGRQFHAIAPSEKWVSDITYIPTQEGWLYLAAVPFEELGFRTDLGTTPYPEYTRDFLYGVPLVLFGLPALLFALHELSEPDEAKAGEE